MATDHYIHVQVWNEAKNNFYRKLVKFLIGYDGFITTNYNRIIEEVDSEIRNMNQKMKMDVALRLMKNNTYQSLNFYSEIPPVIYYINEYSPSSFSLKIEFYPIRGHRKEDEDGL